MADQAELHTQVATLEARLRSHRLSDSSSDLSSDAVYSQLSSISSQPSSVPFSKLAEAPQLVAKEPAQSHHGVHTQQEADPAHASTVGSRTSSGNGSSIDMYDIPQAANTFEENQGADESDSLAAESTLLDAWTVPFGSVMTAPRSALCNRA